MFFGGGGFVFRKLTAEQENILRFVMKGHNALITGQAGTGKSVLVSEIISNMKKTNRNVAVICSSGIACSVYDVGIACTVHSFYGLQVCDMPSHKLIDRSLQNPLVTKRLSEVDVLIWDEASMSSQRLLELVNALHHHLCKDEMLAKKPFGGKQVILVGEFLQLRPIPNIFDEGNFMFSAPIFDIAISHRYELKQVMRQDNESFLSALKELRMGTCSLETERYLHKLSREIEDLENRKNAVHIYFNRMPVLLHNRSVLETLPGDVLTFSAIREGQKVFDWPGEDVLFLKPNAKVMLIYNKSTQLHNGSRGIFKGVLEEKIEVYFPGVGKILLEQETWFHRNRQGSIDGSVWQYPLVLAYALTCHKSQGLTLPAAVVHCSREFVSGLTYVAVSRVRSPETLQLVNFRSRNLLKPSQDIVNECSTSIGEVIEDCTCCCMRDVREELFGVSDRGGLIDEEVEVLHFSFPIGSPDDDSVEDAFESGNTQNVDIIEVSATLDKHQSQLSELPDNFPFDKLMSSLREENGAGECDSLKNTVLDDLLGNKIRKLSAFTKLLWYHVFLIFQKHLNESESGVEVNIAREGFTIVTGKFHALLTSEVFVAYRHGLFEGNTSLEQRIIAGQIAMFVFQYFMENLQKMVSTNHEEEPVSFSVMDMSGPGKSKVRHVGAWAIRKVLEHSRRYAKNNIFTSNINTVDMIRHHVMKCQLLDEEIIVPFSTLQEETVYPETLEVTEARQYRERGLIHISDKCYIMFMHLEQMRVDLINEFKGNTSRENLVDEALKLMEKDERMCHLWLDCFCGTTLNKEQMICVEELRLQITERYVHMGAHQYLKDYRRSHNLKKTAELRKRIMQRRTKKQQIQDSVPFKEILADRSRDKIESHARLAVFVHKHKVQGLTFVYQKLQLKKLCNAYMLKTNAKENKLALAKKLVGGMKNRGLIPNPMEIDNREYRVVSTQQETGIRLRLRLV